MGDELGRGSGGESPLSDDLHSETLVENHNTDTENQVEDSYAEGGDGGEIMVEIVGSDVFVDGVSGTEEADLGTSEIGEENKRQRQESETAQLSEAMDVSSNIGESELELLELKDDKNYVGTGENKIMESELRLPELEEAKNNVVTGECGSGLVEQKDGKHHVFTESVDVAGEGVENKIGESDLGLPKLRDEKDLVVSEAMDVCSEGVENEIGETELGLQDSKEGKINYVVTEALDVSGEVDENKVEVRELGLPKLKEEKENDVIITEEIEGTFSEPLNVEVGISPVQTQEAIVTIPMEISEDKTIKNEVADEKEDRHDSQIVPSEVSLGLNSEAPDNVEVDEVDGAIVRARGVNPEDKIIKDEAVDDKANTNLDHLVSNSHDGQIAPLEASLRPNGEGPESEISQVDGIDSAMVMSQTVISEGSAIKDEAVGKKPCKVPNQDSCYGEGHENIQVDVFDNVAREEAKKNCEKCLFAEIKNLIVKSDALDSDYFHGTKFESTHERAAVEEVDALLDFIDEESNVNPPDLSCVGNDETLKSGGDLETDMVHQKHVVPNDKESSQPDDGFSTDAVNMYKIQEALGDGGLSENVEEIVFEESKQSLECKENDKIPNDLEHCCLAESKEPEEVSMIITEPSYRDIDERDSIDLIPSEVISVEAVSNTTQVNILPEISEKSELPFDSNTVSLGEIVEKVESEAMEVDFEIGNEESSPEAENFKFPDEETKSESYLKMKQPGYFPSPETEGHFSVSDLVWGKVRSHPWWPGQIFDPADASENAVKHYKKDSYLVAYFGDQTFAWNDSSLLKHFRANFYQIEKQSDSEAFQNAVDFALEEVFRRVELGLACSCIPKDVFCKIEAQIVENTGIREDSSNRYSLDHSTGASSFEPDKFLEFIRHLAPVALSGPERLDLVIVRAQLSSYYRFKGCRPLTEFLEIYEEKITGGEIVTASLDIKEDESFVKKQKALDPLTTDGYDKRVSIYAAQVSTLMGPNTCNNKPSFKIGECIRRVASQLTGKDETSIDDSLKNTERRSMVLSIESFSVSGMLSQLERVSQEPMRRHNFLNVIHTFFMGFRSSIALNRRGRKRRPEQTAPGGPTEGFEFDDVSDSYWKGRFVQNYSELNGSVGNLHVVPIVSAKPARRPNSRKRYSDLMVDSELDERIKRRKQESSPAELILYFAESNRIPTEINLNKMFRRFGSLMESETEVDHESGCAKVIFKRGSDAEIARNSSEAFHIFGPVLVNYRIGYEPVVSVSVLPMALPEDTVLMQ